MITEQFAMDIDKLDSQEGLTTETTIVPVGSGATTQQEEGTTTDTTEAPPVEGEEQEADVNIIDHLKALHEVTDELPNDVEGMQKLIDIVGVKKATSLLEEKFTKYPVMKELEAHLEAGKTIESFFNVKQVETSKLSLHSLTGDETKDAELKAYFKDVIKADCAEKGMTDRQIKILVESAELEGTLEEDYKEAVGSWNGRRDLQAKQLGDTAEQQRLADIEEQKEIITKMSTLIDAGTVGEALIPVAERGDFKKFQLEQDKDGYTARNKAIANLSLENSLLIDYLIFKDFKVKGLTPAPSKIASLGTLNNGRKGSPDGSNSGNAAATQQLPDFGWGQLKQ